MNITQKQRHNVIHNQRRSLQMQNISFALENRICDFPQSTRFLSFFISLLPPSPAFIPEMQENTLCYSSGDLHQWRCWQEKPQLNSRQKREKMLGEKNTRKNSADKHENQNLERSEKAQILDFFQKIRRESTISRKQKNVCLSSSVLRKNIASTDSQQQNQITKYQCTHTLTLIQMWKNQCYKFFQRTV